MHNRVKRTCPECGHEVDGWAILASGLPDREISRVLVYPGCGDALYLGERAWHEDCWEKRWEGRRKPEPRPIVEDGQWCAPAIGCPRHRGEWHERRCYHLGNRFVDWVQMDNWDGRPGGGGWSCFIDYVEDLPEGGVIVEPNHANNAGEAEELWQRQVAKMYRGEPPDKDAGN